MDVVLWVIVGFAVLGAANRIGNTVKKGGQKMRGRNRCASCGSRLKAVQGSYMPTCRKCGSVQPWAS